MQLECRHLPAGRETGRGVLAKEGRRCKGKSCTGEGSETRENGPFVGFGTGCGGGGLVWFFCLYCSKPPAQLAALSAPCCRCVQGEGERVGLQSWPGRSDLAALFAWAQPRAGAPFSCRKATIPPRRVARGSACEEGAASLPDRELYGPFEGGWILLKHRAMGPSACL